MKTQDARGFFQYGELTDTYGATVRVKESSSAEESKVWIVTQGGSVNGNNGAAHLNLEQAKRVRDALEEWIKDQEFVDKHSSVG